MEGIIRINKTEIGDHKMKTTFDNMVGEALRKFFGNSDQNGKNNTHSISAI